MAATAGTESLSDLANDIGEVEQTVVAGDEDKVRLVFRSEARKLLDEGNLQVVSYS